MAKPPAKEEKAAPDGAAAVTKPKSKRIAFIAAGILLLVIIGGAVWYFTLSGSHSGANEPVKKHAKEHASAPPKFIALEPFTVNLQSEEAEKSLQVFLQIGITLKIVDPELEEKIKASMPEIRSRLVFLLSNKHASELHLIEGKKQLVQEIIDEINAILGLRPMPVHHSKPITHEGSSASGVEAASSNTAAPAEVAPVAHGSENNDGIVDVLFTSFIIQ